MTVWFVHGDSSIYFNVLISLIFNNISLFFRILKNSASSSVWTTWPRWLRQQRSGRSTGTCWRSLSVELAVVELLKTDHKLFQVQIYYRLHPLEGTVTDRMLDLFLLFGFLFSYRFLLKTNWRIVALVHSHGMCEFLWRLFEFIMIDTDVYGSLWMSLLCYTGTVWTQRNRHCISTRCYSTCFFCAS